MNFKNTDIQQVQENRTSDKQRVVQYFRWKPVNANSGLKVNRKY